MTVPTRNVGCIKATECARFNDDIFQCFINRMSEMNITIGIGRTIMQNKLFTSSASRSNLLIEIFIMPFFENTRLSLGEIGAHWKCRVRQI